MLVPAAMTLMGNINWWSPAPLRRLHASIGINEGSRPIPVALALDLRADIPAEVVPENAVLLRDR